MRAQPAWAHHLRHLIASDPIDPSPAEPPAGLKQCTMNNPIRTMFAALAKAHAGNPSSAAYDVVVDCIDMEMIPSEVMLQVIIGKESLAEALRDGAVVQIDMAVGCCAENEQAAKDLAVMMRRAAEVFDGLGVVCPAAA